MVASRTTPPIIGDQFGKWIVIGNSFIQDSGRRTVPCRCECGTERNVEAYTLRNGQSISCGCWRQERASQSRRHGHAIGAKNPLYWLWKNIKARCNNPKSYKYKYYGGRGIKIHPEWENDAGAFIEWIETNLGPRPVGMTLDRINNDNNYEPGNLRWATQAEQNANKQAANGLPAPTMVVNS